MGILAALSRPSVKDIEKSGYDQATLEFATASDNQELIDGTEAEHGQVPLEFAPSCDYQELIDEAEEELDQIVSDLYKKAEDQSNQIITTIKSEAENDRMTSESSSSCDYRELVDGIEIEFDQIISDLHKRTEDQCKQIGAIIKSEVENGRVTSEFDSSCDYRELVDGTEAEFGQVISDLYKRAKDQCNQIISTIQKAFEADLEYADALCGLKNAYEDNGECDLTELQDNDKQMKTIKHFRLHIDTCDIYAIEQRADATLVGCCGPLAEDALEHLDSYDYSDKKNAWVQKNLNKLILWFP
ncbi:MAG: hypothetical protein GY845_10210 [Planctomycetes bacterium]|nr:hypothetical protein [Planctomycetota bacterium]